MKELGIVDSPPLNSGNNSSHRCHHRYANGYINIHQCSGVSGTGIVGQLVSVFDPETISNRGQCRTKMCELRYCMWVFISLKNQSLCFPQLWYWDAFPSSLKTAMRGTALHLQQPHNNCWTRHTSQPAPQLPETVLSCHLQMDGQSMLAAA